MTLTIDDLIQNLIANNNGKKDELITTIEKSANYGYKVAVDKACEWLDCYIDNYLFIDAENKAGIRWDDFINDFKQAMEGGEE